MTKRQERMMRQETARFDEMMRLADRYLEDLKEERVTLKEAKIVVERMGHILTISERHRPETLLSDITLRGW